MRPNRLLTLGGYLVTLYLVTVPLAETLIAVWPLQLGDASWRYGAVGLFSQALMTPLLGLLLAVCLALYVQHRVMLRALAVVSGLGALLTIAVIALFLLDAIEMRARLVDAATGAFDVATVFALLKMGATALTGFAMALGAMSAARAMKEATRKRTAAPLVVFAAGGRRKEALSPLDPPSA